MTKNLENINELYTIGHSNHPAEHFLELLIKHKIEVLADVRTSPYSKFASQFNRDELQKKLVKQNIKYVFLGKELGGRPSGSVYYDEDGRVLYNVLAKSKIFNVGIERLLTGVFKYKVAIVCGEEDPMGCHRRLLVGRVVETYKINISHIRGDGRIQIEAELKKQETLINGGKQEDMFGYEKADEWKSIRSVLQKKAHQNFLESSEETVYED